MKDHENIDLKKYTIDAEGLGVAWQAQQVRIHERIRDAEQGERSRSVWSHRWVATTGLILLAIFSGLFLSDHARIPAEKNEILISDEAFMESLEDYDYQLPTSLVVLNEIEGDEEGSYRVIYEIMTP